MISEERLREIEKRSKEANPAPWVDLESGYLQKRYILAKVAGVGGDMEVSNFGSCVCTAVGPGFPDEDQVRANFRFLVHSREDVPDLVTEVRRQHARLAELEARLIALGGDPRRR